MTGAEPRTRTRQTRLTARPWVVRPARPGDMEFIDDRWDHYFGDYDGVRSVVEIGCDPENSNYEYNRCFTAVAGDERIGAAVASVGSGDYIEDCLNVAADRHVYSEGNGYIHLVFVDRAWRNRGVASRLLDECLRWVRRNGRAAFAVSWQRDDHVDSSLLFEQAGFDRIDYIDEYYATHGTRTNCPDCGSECTCDAAIYGRTL